MTSFDSFIADLGSGALLQRIMIAHGVDIPTQTAAIVMHVQEQLGSVMGSDAEHLMITAEIDGNKSSQVHVAFQQGYENLLVQYHDDIVQVLGGIKGVSI